MATEQLGAAPSVNNDLVRKTDLDTAVPLTTALTNSRFAQASAGLTLTTTVTDITGATVTITTQVANTVVMVFGVFDMAAVDTSSGTDAGVGHLNVDGTDVTTSNAIYRMTHTGTTVHRATSSQVWRITLASAGSHTLKLRGSKTSATAGTYSVTATHTTIHVLGRFT